MAKEFKEYDKKYAHLEGILSSRVVIGRTRDVKRWKYAELMGSYGAVEIRYAVYLSDTADKWQRFRVGLKTLTTQQKLLLLEARYAGAMEMDEMGYHLEAKLERTRIDNYIGALKRGGQLNSKYEVVK